MEDDVKSFALSILVILIGSVIAILMLMSLTAKAGYVSDPVCVEEKWVANVEQTLTGTTTVYYVSTSDGKTFELYSAGMYGKLKPNKCYIVKALGSTFSAGIITYIEKEVQP